jgi:short-subunit dehydrogenase involved in D-alanine esterification of teichoic acids
MKLSGRRILVTGGGSGIGLELARRLAKDNEVVITGRDEERLTRAQADVPRSPGQERRIAPRLQRSPTLMPPP